MKIINTRAELYKRYRRLAYSLASKMAQKFNRPYRELLEESLHALAFAVCAYWTTGVQVLPTSKLDKTKCQAVTWLYQCIYWHLMDYCMKPAKRRELPLQEAKDKAKQVTWLTALRAELGEEGRALLGIVLEAPGALAHELSPRAPQRSRKALQAYLTQVGWDTLRIERAWTQMEYCLGV